MAVPFRFDTVLRVREAERDRCRVTLVQEQQREAALGFERQRVTTERAAVLQDLCALEESAEWSAEQAITRRQHAERLSLELARIGTALADVAAALSRCRSELLEADTAVKGLEKLAGRHAADQRRSEQKSADRDREDAWRAA
jgi:flagellar biosynthesis chaperone FliJ